MAQQALCVRTEFGSSATTTKGLASFCADGASDFWQTCDELAWRSLTHSSAEETWGGGCPELKVGTSGRRKLTKDTPGIGMKPMETSGESAKGSMTLHQRRHEFAVHGLSVSTGCDAPAEAANGLQQVQLGVGCVGSEIWKTIDGLAQRQLTQSSAIEDLDSGRPELKVGIAARERTKFAPDGSSGPAVRSEAKSQGSLRLQQLVLSIDVPESPRLPLSRKLKSSGTQSPQKSRARSSCELGENSPAGVNAVQSPMHRSSLESKVGAKSGPQLPKHTSGSRPEPSELFSDCGTGLANVQLSVEVPFVTGFSCSPKSVQSPMSTKSAPCSRVLCASGCSPLSMNNTWRAMR